MVVPELGARTKSPALALTSLRAPPGARRKFGYSLRVCSFQNFDLRPPPELRACGRITNQKPLPPLVSIVGMWSLRVPRSSEISNLTYLGFDMERHDHCPEFGTAPVPKQTIFLGASSPNQFPERGAPRQHVRATTSVAFNHLADRVVVASCDAKRGCLSTALGHATGRPLPSRELKQNQRSTRATPKLWLQTNWQSSDKQ